MSNRLREIGKECLEETEGLVDNAIILFWDYVKEDDTLFRELFTPLAKLAIRETVEGLMREKRPDYWPTRNGIYKKGKESQMSESTRNGYLAFFKKNLRDYYSYPMKGGKMLGDALRPEVEKEALFHSKQSQAMMESAVWFRSIIRQMSNDTDPVREVLTQEKLRQLQETAIKRVEMLLKQKA